MPEPLLETWGLDPHYALLCVLGSQLPCRGSGARATTCSSGLRSSSHTTLCAELLASLPGVGSPSFLQLGSPPCATLRTKLLAFLPVVRSPSCCLWLIGACVPAMTHHMPGGQSRATSCGFRALLGQRLHPAGQLSPAFPGPSSSFFVVGLSGSQACCPFILWGSNYPSREGRF